MAKSPTKKTKGKKVNQLVLPSFPYGAVYFRKSNPPRENWEQDYCTAAEDGMNLFRHWFLWSAIEIAPGKFDWSDYDRQLDLAAKYGIKTIIAEMITSVPEWAFRKFPHARYERYDGSRDFSQMSDSCAVGGMPGLCLDHDEVRGLAGNFLRELAKRYRTHPGLGGYDLANECACNPTGGHADYCFCPATAAKFRLWLKAKYKDLKTLGEAWYRYSYADWEDVQPPRLSGPWPDVLDWLQFRIDNFYEQVRWRAQIIRELDSTHPVTAHGQAISLERMAISCSDDWRSAAEVDIYGFTWVTCRWGNEPWRQWCAVDLVRAGSRGKPFWHAEMQGGPLWMQPQVIGRPREDGRIAEPEDIRLWNMVSYAGGATGSLFPRWRPLLDGPLFGAFGPYGMDGSRTPRSEMASRMAKWTSREAQAELWAARPVKGKVGIIVVPESQLFCYAQQGTTDYYTHSAQGAYQGFFDNNIQADWVHIDDIDDYDFLYLPYPIMLRQETAEALRRWVEGGGKLISEGCPGYFGDRGHAGTVQPNLGLKEVFGARESYVEFTPDLLDGLSFRIGELDVPGGLFLQAYDLLSGQAAGWYEDGRVAVVEHTFGQGRTRLIGTFPGVGHFYHPSHDSRRFYRELLDWANKQPHVRVSEPGVTARLHSRAGATYLWVVNYNPDSLLVRLELSPELGPFHSGQVFWGDGKPKIKGQHVTVHVSGRDASIIKLLPL